MSSLLDRFQKRAHSLLRVHGNYSPHLSPNLSIRRLCLIKIVVFRGFLISHLKNFSKKQAALSNTKALKNTHSGIAALVIANGPSARKLRASEARDSQKVGSLKVFAVNFYFSLEPFEELVPDYLVLSDGATHRDSSDSRTVELWQHIDANPSIKLISPISWHNKSEFDDCHAGTCLHFNDVSFEGWSTNISPVKSRGYPNNTAYKALAFAHHLGFDQIMVIGLDNTMFNQIYVTSKNRIMLPSLHAGDYYQRDVDVTSHYELGIGDVFYDLSELFLGLRRSFLECKILNLDQSSLIDCFTKLEPGSEFSSLVTWPST